MANKTITMKKGSTQISVDAGRQKHYESFGYELVEPKTTKKSPKDNNSGQE